MFFACAALLLVLVAMQLSTGVTQQWFESFHLPDPYAARLLAQGAWLRAIVAVDDVFVAAYSAAAVLVALMLRERGSALWVLVLTLGVFGGLLDLEENHHLLAMLTVVERGGALEAASLEHRMIFSSLKWLLSPLAYCFFTLGYEVRLLRWFTWGWVMPLTAVVLAVEDPVWLKPLAFARLLSVVLGFVTIAVVLRSEPGRSFWARHGTLPASERHQGAHSNPVA
jgi:hypothetical protein